MTFVALANLDQFQEEEAIAVTSGEHEILVLSYEGEFFAIANECSHAQVQLDGGEVSGCAIECPAHGARFDLRTGRALTRPATRPVAVFPTKVDGTTLFVDLDNPLDFLAEAE